MMTAFLLLNVSNEAVNLLNSSIGSRVSSRGVIAAISTLESVKLDMFGKAK